MGCDIHLRVEYLAPSETLDQALQVIPEGPPEWVPAERLTPVRESSLMRWCSDSDGRVDEVELARYPDPYLEYEDRWYSGRDYGLFGALAGVRGDVLLWDERGFPDDASDSVRLDYEGWGMDAHTPSWQTLDELLAVDWKDVWESDGYVNSRWLDLLERLKDLAFAKCENDHSRVRITYWFDN